MGGVVARTKVRLFWCQWQSVCSVGIGLFQAHFIFLKVKFDAQNIESDIFEPVSVIVPSKRVAKVIVVSNDGEFDDFRWLYRSDMDGGSRVAFELGASKAYINEFSMA